MFNLQRNIGKQLEELPFQITRYGKVIAVVNKYNVTLNYSRTKPLTDYCKHEALKGLCKYGCK